VGETATVLIERAERRHVWEVRVIDAQVFPSPWSEKLTIKEIEGAGRVHFVALVDHKVVGHAGLAILDRDAHITTIAVSPPHQRQGIGSQLMGELLAASDANGCTGITLEVRASNAPAIAFYKRHGMTSSGVRSGYYGDNGEDAVIMWLRTHGVDR